MKYNVFTEINGRKVCIMNRTDDFVKSHAEICRGNDSINKLLYDEYGVKKGLRDGKEPQ